MFKNILSLLSLVLLVISFSASTVQANYNYNGYRSNSSFNNSRIGYNNIQRSISRGSSFNRNINYGRSSFNNSRFYSQRNIRFSNNRGYSNFSNRNYRYSRSY